MLLSLEFLKVCYFVRNHLVCCICFITFCYLPKKKLPEIVYKFLASFHRKNKKTFIEQHMSPVSVSEDVLKIEKKTS